MYNIKCVNLFNKNTEENVNEVFFDFIKHVNLLKQNDGGKY